MDYKNGKIYKITSNSTDKIYIGSTCQPLCKRMTKHRGNYKLFINSKRGKTTSFELIALGDAIITLIEDFPCERKEQLQARERYHIELNKDICVNKCIPTRTRKEYEESNEIKLKRAEYRQANKEAMKVYATEYRQVNKEAIKLKRAEYQKVNKEAIALKTSAYYQKNKELIAERNKAYYQFKKV
jgi:hypothetical protein